MDRQPKRNQAFAAARLLSAAFAVYVPVVGGLFCIVPQEPPGEPELLPAARPPDAPQAFYGSRSCQAAACHGSTVADLRPPSSRRRPATSARRDEFLVWFNNDPHAKANATLQNARSQQIFRNLGVDPVADGTKHRELYLSCLACHGQRFVGRRPMAGGADARTRVQTEGVGCESCHGPAAGWLGEHYRSDFRAKTNAQKQALGFVATKNLWIRARQCASCHVGGPGRDVTHDLIAAGHPPLRFDFGAALARLPKHWKVENDYFLHERDPDFAMRQWFVGQLVAADAALDQMVRRAEQTDTDAVWPEFAEFDCFACHHDLAGVVRRPPANTSTAGSQQPALLPMAQWNLGVTRMLSRKFAPEVYRELETLRRTLQSGMYQRQAVARAARDTRQRLNEWMKQLGDDPQLDELRLSHPQWRHTLELALLSDTRPPLPSGYDQACQAFEFLQAWDRDRQSGPDGSQRTPDEVTAGAVEQLNKLLAYPPGSQATDQPPSKRALGEALKQLHQLLLDEQSRGTEQR